MYKERFYAFSIAGSALARFCPRDHVCDQKEGGLEALVDCEPRRRRDDQQ